MGGVPSASSVEPCPRDLLVHGGPPTAAAQNVRLSVISLPRKRGINGVRPGLSVRGAESRR